MRATISEEREGEMTLMINGKELNVKKLGNDLILPSVKITKDMFTQKDDSSIEFSEDIKQHILGLIKLPLVEIRGDS